MNLNVSTKFTNSFQGNICSGELGCSESGFDVFFQGLKTSIEGFGLAEDKLGKANKDEKDDDLIQSMLINLQLLIQLEKMDNGDTLKNEDYNNLINELGKIDLELINQNLNTSENSKDVINELLKKFFSNKDLNELSKLNTDLASRINEILESKDSNITNLDDNSQNLNDSSLKSEKLKLNTSEIIDNLNKSKDEQNYKKLEVSSLSNKNNIISDNSQNTEDKEINALESILDGENGKNFAISNNIMNNNINNSSGNQVENVPIKEVRQEFIGDDIVKTVKYLKSNGLEEIKIKISPRELGDMTIKLIKNPEETKLLITISKEEVYNLVNKNIGEITKHLNDLNINVKEVSVDIKSENKNFFSDNLNQEFNKKNQQNKSKQNKYQGNELENIDDVEEIKIEEDNLNILI